jgi:hypothetical protein
VDESTGGHRRATAEGTPSGAVASTAGLRDAAAIVARVADDEGAARETRAACRVREIEPIAPDARIAPLVLPGEVVFAVRSSALLDRRQPPAGAAGWSGCLGLAGDLYVTSTRLLLVGRTVVVYDLDEIQEVVVAGERLLLTLRDGAGVIVEVVRPRLLRVEIAAARASGARRAAGLPEPARDRGPG